MKGSTTREEHCGRLFLTTATGLAVCAGNWHRQKLRMQAGKDSAKAGDDAKSPTSQSWWDCSIPCQPFSLFSLYKAMVFFMKMQKWAWTCTNWTNRKLNNWSSFHFLLSILMQNISSGLRTMPTRLAAQILLLPFYKWGNWSQERLRDLSKACEKPVAQLGLSAVDEFPLSLSLAMGFGEKSGKLKPSSLEALVKMLASLLEGYPC